MSYNANVSSRPSSVAVEKLQTMQTTEFRFQQLPSSAEIHSLSPISCESRHSNDSKHGRASQAFTRRIHDHPYDPIQNIRHEWPLNPDQWAKSPLFKIVSFLGHMVLTLSPIIFLMLAFAAISVHGHPLSRKGQVVLEAAKVGPSLFPIVFAAIVGRLMRTYALWRAQRGSSIGLLEQFNGSQNLLAAVERAFHLRGLHGVGFLIVVLWCLSPLGGQSSLRVLGTSRSGTEFQTSLSYFDSDNYTTTALLGASALDWGWPSLSAIFQACLLAPDKVISSSVDLWGNVKVPLMQSLPLYSGAPDQDWIEVPVDEVVYSSLSGIMVSGLNRNASANFTIETTYLNLSCSDPRHFELSGSDEGIEGMYRDVRQWTGNLTYHNDPTQLLFGDPQSAYSSTGSRQWSSFTVDTNWNYTDPAAINQTNINIIYLSMNGDDGILTGYNCSVAYSYVEAWVSCDGVDCLVAKMRPSRDPHGPSNITPLNQGVSNYYALLLSQFPWATGEQHASATSPTDWYIAGSETPYNPSFGSAVYSNVTGAQVSRRLGALLNTFWQTSITLSTLVRPQISENSTSNVSTVAYPSLRTTAIMQTETDIYVANRVWVGFTVIISFIMLFCSIAGATFKYLSTVPDILGYVSSLTKDNPYFHGPESDDTLDGMERTRILQNVVVQIGNVNPGDERRYIALRSIANGEDKRASRLHGGTPRLRSPI